MVVILDATGQRGRSNRREDEEGPLRRGSGWSRGGVARATLIVVGSLAFESANITDVRAGGSWMIGASLVQRSSDLMSVGDDRPRPLGPMGGTVEFGHGIGHDWLLSAAGRFDGGWSDFQHDADHASGRLEDFGWSARLGVDRLVPIGSRVTAFAGVGATYGEARSWFHTTQYSVTLREVGPRSYLAGGDVRVGLTVVTASRFQLVGQLGQEVYHAHANSAPWGVAYHWLGRGTAVSVGLRWVTRGREP